MAMQSRVDQPGPRRGPSRAPDPFSRFKTSRAAPGGFSVSDVDANLLSDAVAAWTSKGFAISFGFTSDGGALGVILYANGDKFPSYHPTLEGLEAFLTELVADSQAPEP